MSDIKNVEFNSMSTLVDTLRRCYEGGLYENFEWVSIDSDGEVCLSETAPVYNIVAGEVIWRVSKTARRIGYMRYGSFNDASDCRFKISDLIGEVKTKSDAVSMLLQTIDTIGQRGEGYDDGNERSMPKVVALFNELTGHNLTAGEGWKFMILLKLVRSQQGNDKLDNYVDGAGYFALASEELDNE